MENQPPTMAPPPSPPPSNAAIDAQQKVSGPAIGLLVTAIIGIVYQMISLLFNIFYISILDKIQGMQPTQGLEGFETFTKLFTGIFAVVGFIFALTAAVIIIFGSIRMKRLQSWGLAVTASILAMVPCFSPCCCAGLPIGIWALVVLMKPEIKAAFK